MPQDPQQKSFLNKRTALLVAIVVASVGLIVWQVGNPITAALNWWLPPTPGEVFPDRQTTLPSITPRGTWEGLRGHGTLPITVVETARENPFVVAAPTDAPAARDEKRLRDLRLLQEKLATFRDAAKSYPLGSDVILGSDTARCLTSEGWGAVGECEEGGVEVLLKEVPRDPGAATFRYSGSGDTYSIFFTLENQWGEFAPGVHELLATGIRLP